MIEPGLAVLEMLLAGEVPASEGPFCAGAHVTVADLFLVPQLYAARRFSVDLTPFPRLVRADAAAPRPCRRSAPRIPTCSQMPSLRADVVRRVGLVLAAFLWPALVHADATPAAELPVRDATLAWDKELLSASFVYRDLVDAKTEVELSSGLPVTLSLRVYVLHEGEKTPVALAVRSCRVVYDLWDEVYRIRILSHDARAAAADAPKTGGERNVVAFSTESLLRQCAEATSLPIVSRKALVRNTRYFLGVLAEVNPVSAKTLEQMRRWVTRPPGATEIGPGDALFGSFALLFVHELSDADRTVRFRTRAFKPKE